MSHPEDPKLLAQVPVGVFLREHRKRGRIKLREVADATGFSIAYVSRIETGDRVPPADTVVRLFTAMGQILADKQAAA